MPALRRSLPALRRLRLEVVECTPEIAAHAVALLAELPAGVEVALAVHSHWSGEAHYNYPDLGVWPHEVLLPLMAAIPASLKELELVGLAGLPTNKHQLAALRNLILKVIV